MITEIGNIIKNYGKKYNVIVTKETGDNLLNDTSYILPNSLIVASPSNDVKKDYGTPSIFASDHNGDVVRLTYTFNPGKGLVVNPNNHDVLEMALDDYSIKPGNNNELYVDMENIIDRDTIQLITKTNGEEIAGDNVTYINPGPKLKVITANLDPATGSTLGVVKINSNTLTNSYGEISVNTQFLDYVDDDNDISGIVRHDAISKDVSFSNGYIKVNSSYLDPATSDDYGVVKPDNNFTFVENGVLTVKNFTYAYTDTTTQIISGRTYNTKNYYRGIIAPDNITTKTTNGILSVITSGLEPTTASGALGVMKVDNLSLNVTNNGKVSVNRYGEIITMLNTLDSKLAAIRRSINMLEERIVALETPTVLDKINIITDDNNVIEEVVTPVWDAITRTVKSDKQYVKFNLNLITNCAFKVSITYVDNGAPAISLTSIKVGNESPVTEQIAQCVFKNTENNVTAVELTFSASNFSSTDLTKAYLTTQINVKVTSINDESVYSNITFNIKRFNEQVYYSNNETIILQEFETLCMLAECNGANSLQWYNRSLNDTSIYSITNNSYADKNETIPLKLRVGANLEVNELSPVNVIKKQKTQSINNNISNLYNNVARIQNNTDNDRNTYAYKNYNSNIILESQTADTLDNIIFAYAKLVYENSSFNVGLLTNDQINEINEFATINEMIADINYPTIKTSASANLLDSVDRIDLNNLNNLQTAITSESSSTKYVRANIVNEFPADYITLLANDAAYAGYIKVNDSNTTETYGYYDYNSNTVKYVTTNLADTFITVSSRGMDSEGYTNIALRTNSSMPNNISYRNTTLNFTTYDGSSLVPQITPHQSTIKLQQNRLNAYEGVVEIRTTANPQKPWATVEVTKSNDLYPLFSSADNTDYKWSVDFSYYFVNSDGKQVKVDGYDEYNATIVVPSSDPNYAMLDLDFELPKTSSVKTLKINPDTISIKQLTGINYKINNYSAGIWNIIEETAPTLLFANAYVNKATITRSSTDVRSQKFLSVTFEILPGANTTIANGQQVRLAVSPKYVTPDIYVVGNDGTSIVASSNYNSYEVLPQTLTWNNGITMTLKFNGQKDEQSAPDYMKYFSFNIELEAVTNGTIVSADRFVIAGTNIGPGTASQYTNGYTVQCEIINKGY